MKVDISLNKETKPKVIEKMHYKITITVNAELVKMVGTVYQTVKETILKKASLTNCK